MDLELQQKIFEYRDKTASIKQEYQELRSACINEIREMMEEFSITIDDIKPSGKSNKLYRDPLTGKTWSGHGRNPDWVLEYVAKGGNKEDLRVDVGVMVDKVL